jgi:hypothetical protein
MACTSVVLQHGTGSTGHWVWSLALNYGQFRFEMEGSENEVQTLS